ncbi:MAG: DUF4012 domain-containing protein [Candidatus Doudnabacteria bacterium]|nr:DUF4012 domain-containing protein [Candidatus Doudnabacteria bacterium]
MKKLKKKPKEVNRKIIRIQTGLRYYKPSKFDIGFIVRRSYDRIVSIDKSLFQPAKAIKKTKRVYTYQWRPSKVAAFAAAVLVLALSLQGLAYLASVKDASGEILGAATSAYTDLSGAQASLSDQNFESALQLFSSAQNNLEIAQDKLAQYKALTLVNSQAKGADNILSGAYLLSQAGSKLTESLQLFDMVTVSDQGIETQDFNKKLRQNRLLLKESLALLNESSEHFDKVSNLPADYISTLDEAKRQVQELSGVLEGLINLEDLYLTFFDGSPKTYLLIFQNYDEARATGGFIGTYGVVKINQGLIEKLDIQSIYDFDGSFYEDVAAPGPFQPEIKKWGLRDANWFVDFRQSSAKLLEFFEKGKETADGVVAFTPKIFEGLLEIVGPIHMDQYGVILTASNFQEVVQYKTSVDYDLEQNQPKKFLADFALILLNRLNNLKKEQWFSFFQILQTNLLEKHLLLFSKQSDTQTQIESLGFGGQVLPTDGDYLLVVNSNQGGTKTDLEIVQKLTLKSQILTDGTVINNLRIKRENAANEPNRDYLRVLVPKGSELISATGLDSDPHLASVFRGLKTDPDLAAWDIGELKFDRVFVREEAGKTEFAGWVNTDSKEISQVELTYSLPFKVNPKLLDRTAVYSMLFQKQLGSRGWPFDHTLVFEGLKTIWSTTNVAPQGQQANFSYQSDKDGYWAILLSQDN